MTADTGHDGRLDGAARRLERAVILLARRVANRLAEAGASAGGLIDQERAQLAADLDAARARERQLEEAGVQASAALARAIVDIRDALDQAEG